MKAINIILVIFLFSSIYSIDEIRYRVSRGNFGRLVESFTVTFNKETGITAEYLEGPKDGGDTVKGKKKYDLTTEDLGLPSLKELFKLFNKIDFPEETDWMEPKLLDAPIWHLYVDDKDYHSNKKTDFLEEFSKIVNLDDIKEYCASNY